MTFLAFHDQVCDAINIRSGEIFFFAKCPAGQFGLIYITAEGPIWQGGNREVGYVPTSEWGVAVYQEDPAWLTRTYSITPEDRAMNADRAMAQLIQDLQADLQQATH